MCLELQVEWIVQSAKIRYQKYTLKDSEGQILLDTDFAAVLNTPKDSKERLLSDLALTIPKDAHMRISELQLVSSGEEKQLVLGSENNLAEIQEWLGFEKSPISILDLSNIPEKNISIEKIRERLKDNPDLLNVSQTPPASSNDELQAQAEEIAGEAGVGLVEAVAKIVELESELEAQRNADEAQIGIQELEREFAAMEEMLKDASELAQRREKIRATLSRYGELVQADLSAQEQEYKRQISSSRQEELAVALKSGTYKSVPGAGDRDVKQDWMVIPLAGLGVLTLALGVGAFAWTNNLVTLVVALMGSMLQLGFFWLINNTPARLTAGIEVVPEKLLSDQSKVSPLKALWTKIEKFFVDKAWIAAWKHELNDLEVSITTLLQGQNYEELIQARVEMEGAIAQLKGQIDSQVGREIAPEEYLRKRRDLDVQKIERARLESELRGSGKLEQINLLVENLGSSGVPVENELLALTGITALKADGSELQIQRSEGEWSVEKLSEVDCLGVYFVLELKRWKQNPQWPLVVIDIPKEGDKLAQFINARILLWKNLGQVILVDTK